MRAIVQFPPPDSIRNAQFHLPFFQHLKSNQVCVPFAVAKTNKATFCAVISLLNFIKANKANKADDEFIPPNLKVKRGDQI